MQRRDLLRGSAAAGIAFLSGRASGQTGTKVIPWTDQPAPIPPAIAENGLKNLTSWEDLGSSWITPNDKFFSIAHYNRPQIDGKTWLLNVDGQVNQPRTLSLDQLKAMPRREILFTLECSGDNGFNFNPSLIGNARWAGVSLAETLKAAQLKDDALEVVFYGTDQGDEIVRQNTPLEYKFTSNFARSMPIADAMNPANLLCYDMNGETLPAANGYPCRLIAPGWFGVANVKWLTRVEVRRDRFLGRFMARDYVTIREERHNGKSIMAETSVGRILLKSAPARVVQRGDRYVIEGRAWGRPIIAVEVKIDDGGWTKVRLENSKSEYSWREWNLEWPATPGYHTITSRAIDASGNIQPAMDDPLIANKRTYWESNGQITRQVRIS